MDKASVSVVIPRFKILHFRNGRRIGESRYGYAKCLAHYNRRGKPVGKTLRSFFGEPNHYDIQNRCTGYSRKGRLGIILHYDNRGNLIGQTRPILGLLLLHRKIEMR